MKYLDHLLYVSRATVPLSAASLKIVCAQSATRNHCVSVTGMLLYSRGSFPQLLEGSGATLDALFKRISADSRHTDVQVLLRAPAGSRLFRKWHMGVLNLDINGTQVDRARLEAALGGRPDDEGSGRRALAVLRDFREQVPE